MDARPWQDARGVQGLDANPVRWHWIQSIRGSCWCDVASLASRWVTALFMLLAYLASSGVVESPFAPVDHIAPFGVSLLRALQRLPYAAPRQRA